MVLSGWINITITGLLCFALAVIIGYYYWPKKETAEKAEQPKYRMLDDEED